MAVTPNSITFSHEIGSTLPPSRLVNYFSASGIVNPQNTPDWLTVFPGPASSQIILNSQIENLPPGTYTADITFVTAVLDIDGSIRVDGNLTLGTVTVSVILTEAVEISTSPETLVFNYQFGGTTPVNQTVNVTSDKSWSVTETTNWLDVINGNGTGNGSFQVSVTPTGLSAGNHFAPLTIYDGVTTKQILVTLVITAENTTTEYLYVTPEFLNFGYTITGLIPPKKRIEMNSSDPWTAVKSEPWIDLTETSGSSGVGFLEIGIDNLSGLTAGNHYATVTITAGPVVKNITIQLSVFEFAEELLDPNTLYYSLDNNLIKVSSGRTDTHLQIDLSTIYNGQINNLTYNMPFFKGVSSKRIGQEVEKIIGEQPFIGLGEANLSKPYSPLYFDMIIKEVSIFDGSITQTINLEQVPFIKGEKPLDNWMSENSKTVYRTTTGVVMFSFLGSSYAPINKIIISGAVNQTYNFNNSTEPYYTVTLPLASLNLKVGDVITVTAGAVEINVIIKPEEIEQSFVFWENQWGFWDVIELNGEVKDYSTIQQKHFEYRKDYKTLKQQVLSVKEKQGFKISTGYINSLEEVVAIKNMLLSKNILLLQNNTLTSVKTTTRKLEIYKTNNNLKAYSLTFENKEI